MHLTWLTVFCAALFAASSQINANTIDSAAHPDVCLTSACTSAVDRIFAYGDATINPCDDFFEFSCGTFRKSKNKFLNQIRMIDEMTSHFVQRSANELKPAQLLRDMYEACSNDAQLDALGIGPIMEQVQSVGGWPVLVGDSWDSTNTWSWNQTNKKFRAAGLPFTNLISVQVIRNRLDTKKNRIEISGDFDEYAKDELKSAVELAVALGAKDVEKAEREINETLQFATALRHINENDNNNDEKLTIAELQDKLPFFEWLDYINAMLPAHAAVNSSFVVTVKSLENLEQIQVLLLNTPKRTISNLLVFRALKDMAAYSTREIRNIFEIKELQMVNTCARNIAIDNPISMILFIIKEVLEPKNSKEVTTHIVQTLYDSLSKWAREANWIDAESKRVIETRLEGLKYVVGYFDEFPTNDEIAQFFASINVDKEKYLDSSLRVKKFTTDFKMSQYNETDRKQWTNYDLFWSGDIGFNQYQEEPTFYVHVYNMQIQNMSSERPSYLNYGSIGWNIGRKLIDFVEYVDEDRPESDLWTPETIRAYEKKLNCINGQYDRFMAGKKMPIDGFERELAARAKNLSVHDIGGLKMAYETYLVWTLKIPEEAALPNLNYTKEQLFFIAAGQAMCDGVIDEIRPASGNSQNDLFRYMNAFVNSPKFADAFKCPIGTRMNPTDKCGIW